MQRDLLAQVASGLGQIGGGSGLGPFSAPPDGTTALQNILRIISVIIGVITTVAGIYFLIQFLIGGFEWLSASGDKNRLSKAQDRLTHSLIGLLVVVAAFGVASIIGTLLGLDILVTDPQGLIDALTPGGN